MSKNTPAARLYVSPLERNVHHCLSDASNLVECREVIRRLWSLILKMNEDAKAMARGQSWAELGPEIYWKAQCDALGEDLGGIIARQEAKINSMKKAGTPYWKERDLQNGMAVRIRQLEDKLDALKQEKAGQP